MSDSAIHGPQYTRPPCSSPSPGVCPNSWLLNWCGSSLWLPFLAGLCWGVIIFYGDWLLPEFPLHVSEVRTSNSYTSSSCSQIKEFSDSTSHSVISISILLQGIFPTQGLNRGLPHCRQTPYRLSHQGSLCSSNAIYHCDTMLIMSYSTRLYPVELRDTSFCLGTPTALTKNSIVLLDNSDCSTPVFFTSSYTVIKYTLTHVFFTEQTPLWPFS